MIVTIGFTYHFQHLEFKGGKVGNGGFYFSGQGVVECATLVQIPGNLVQVATDFPILRYMRRYSGEHFFAIGGHSDDGGNLAVKDGLPNILRLAHGDGGTLVLKDSALVFGQMSLDYTFPLGWVIGLVRHGGSTPFAVAICPLINRRKLGCKSELFLKNRKIFLEGNFSTALMGCPAKSHDFAGRGRATE